MTVNFSNGLVGLTLLTGNNAFAGVSSAAPPSAAVLRAKAQFTTQKIAAPWQEKASSTPLSAQVAAIRRLPTLVDLAPLRDRTLPPDLQTSFVAYKALDRLRILADVSARKTTTETDRAALAKLFDTGMNDLQGFLAGAPSDKVTLAFGRPTRRAESLPVPTASTSSKLSGKGLLDVRSGAIPGVLGNEVLQVALSKYGVGDTVTVDLATTPQPPTLDSVAAALNAAIAAVPMRNPDGSVALDASGNPLPKYLSRFSVERGATQWGLALDAPGIEQVALDQIGAPDAVMVATGITAPGAPATTRILRFDDPAASGAQSTLGTIAAIDREATTRAASAPPSPTILGVAPPSTTVFAATTAQAIVTDAQGFSFVVGTTAGDLGANRTTGHDDLFLTKLDSEGVAMWQRTLGSGATIEGAAVALAANGDIVVAGTVTGAFDGKLGDDSDLLVVRFDAGGDEQFSTAIRSVVDERASAIAIGADGSIFVGGTTSTGGGNAFVARLGATGTLEERRSIDSGGTDAVTALAIDKGGDLLVLTRESGTATLRRVDSRALTSDLGSLALGAADARAIAVSASGQIAVGGATSSALSGSQANTTAGGRDGFVARIDAALSGADVTYLATTGQDEVDSLAFMGGDLYAGGRTNGDLGAARRGTTDGFVSRIDSGTGAIASTRQFGETANAAEPVRIAAAPGGAGMIGKLGFARGTLNQSVSARLDSQTSIRAGDEFTIRLGTATHKIVIAAGETLTTLADRIRRITGTKAIVTSPKVVGGTALRIDAKPGTTLALIAGAEDKDALAKLGLDPVRLDALTLPVKNAPKVQPGGTFGLALSEALTIANPGDAAAALKEVKAAISFTQTAYRSLYWDANKEALVNGRGNTGGGTPYQQKQLSMYQDALTRISATTGF
jgi:trimeric autotransporter adhesin